MGKCPFRHPILCGGQYGRPLKAENTHSHDRNIVKFIWYELYIINTKKELS